MGLREWILKPYLDQFLELSKELSNIKAEVEDIKERFDRLENVSLKVQLLEEKLKVLDHITEIERENRLWLRELLKDIEDIRLELEALKLKSEADSSIKAEVDEVELEARVYELIREGVTSPTKLSQALGISKERLYRILKRLMEARLITTIGKGRKKKYVPKIKAESE